MDESEATGNRSVYLEDLGNRSVYLEATGNRSVYLEDLGIGRFIRERPTM